MFGHWSESKREVCKEEESSQVCLKDRRPCSDWFMTEGREGFSELEDRRWEIPDSCPDVYKSPSPWILLRLATIISAGMGQNGIWRGAKDETGDGNGRGGRKWERGSEDLNGRGEERATKEHGSEKLSKKRRVIIEVWMRGVKEFGSVWEAVTACPGRPLHSSSLHSSVGESLYPSHNSPPGHQTLVCQV